ncbi:MAG: hypothetical protein WCR86_13555 [Parabacteroides sp.]
MQVLIGTPAEVVEVLNGLEKIEEKQKSESVSADWIKSGTILLNGEKFAEGSLKPLNCIRTARI